MSAVKPGQIYRNVHGSHIVMDALETREQCGTNVYAWWADFCDDTGEVTGGNLPLEPDAFPGPLWTLVGEVR
jgi:hypothetical protein